MFFWIYKIPTTLLIRTPEEPISHLGQGTYHPERILLCGFPPQYLEIDLIRFLSNPFNVAL
jgi:hypothetical protein